VFEQWIFQIHNFHSSQINGGYFRQNKPSHHFYVPVIFVNP
jgi:hypothetical protein